MRDEKLFHNFPAITFAIIPGLCKALLSRCFPGIKGKKNNENKTNRGGGGRKTSLSAKFNFKHGYKRRPRMSQRRINKTNKQTRLRLPCPEIKSECSSSSSRAAGKEVDKMKNAAWTGQTGKTWASIHPCELAIRRLD